MATERLPFGRVRIIDKNRLVQAFERLDERKRTPLDPVVTAEELHRMMVADGIRPEENAFSREILRMRYAAPANKIEETV